MKPSERSTERKSSSTPLLLRPTLWVLLILTASPFSLATSFHHFSQLERPSFFRTPASLETPEVLESQIRSDVAGAIRKNRNSKSYFEFGTSGYTPRDIFSNVQALQSQDAWGALCKALLALPAADLALFDGEVNRTSNQKYLGCSRLLKTKLVSYWQDNCNRLKEHLKKLATSPSREVASRKTADETVERKISTNQVTEVGQDQLQNHEIVLSFNDGPHPTRTREILNILRKEGVRAHFFHIGRLIQKYPEIESELVKDKEVPGSHTFTHHHLDEMDLSHATDEISRGREEAQNATDTKIPFFRFPYGATNSQLRQILKKKKMTVLHWTLDSQDWKIRDASALYDHVISAVEKARKGILLFHDTQEQTVLALPGIVEALKARGYHFVVFTPQKS